MSKYLVIVESPSKAKTISGFLNKDYKILSSKGHIRDLPLHEFGVDIEGDFEPKYIISPDKKKLVEEIVKESKHVDKVLIATDDDREGEAIGYHLMTVLKLDENDRSRYDRVVFHEITKQAIQSSIENPRDININLFNAQQARRILDRIVGYKLSPLLWQKISKGLSAGRVQSVAVRMIVEKEREIDAFIPQESWDIIALLQKDKISFEAVFDKENLKDKDSVVKWMNDIYKGKIIEGRTKKDTIKLVIEDISQKMLVDNITKKESYRSPSAPFTTSTLQQESSNKLGYSVKQTMQIAQRLYEGVDTHKGRMGLITYMRTDSVNISNIALKQIKEVIKSQFGASYLYTKCRVFKNKIKGAQEAHEAIRPTDMSILPDNVKQYLGTQEYRLYKLIWDRTIATQMADAVLENTTIKLSTNGIPFVAKGQIITFDGFLRVYDNKEKDEILPNVSKGEEIGIKQLFAEQKFSSPPPRYTEATLVKKLEAEGIGRPSTYAPTISTIIDRGYVEKTEDKKLKPTRLGIIVNDFLVQYFPDILDYKFTAKVEEDFDNIEEGTMKWKKVIKDFFMPFEHHYKDVIKISKKVEQKSGILCDKCGAEMIIKNGRYGEFLSCSNYPKCKNIKPLPKEQEELEKIQEKYKDEKCPKCGKEMAVKHSKFGYFLVCNDCKATKSIAQDVGIKCPKCHIGDIILRKTKTGRKFYGCSKYPDCDFISWNKPKKS